MFGQKRIPSREGGVEIVVEELSTRMAMAGHDVTCYNRRGHHVSGSEYDTKEKKEYKKLPAFLPTDKKILSYLMRLLPHWSSESQNPACKAPPQ